MQLTAERQRFVTAVRELCNRECKTLAQQDPLTDGGRLANSPQILERFAELELLGVSQPEEYGGAGAGFADECIFLEETSRGLAPITACSTGLTVAQTYLRWGTEEQKHEIVSTMLSGGPEAIALSGLGAGSDLGGVQLKLTVTANEYVINEQKTWASAAHVAKHLLVLTRTDSTGGKHEDLTLLMVPINTEGLEIRGIETMEARTVNEVFFTDVRVPPKNVVGQPNSAW